MGRAMPKVKSPPMKHRVRRLANALPLPSLPPTVLAEIHRRAEESSQKTMARIRPQMERAIREALKANHAPRL